MKILIKELVGNPRDFDVNLSPAELELADADFEFPHPVAGSLRVSTLGEKQVMAQGDVSTRARSRCVRCLEPVDVVVRAHVNARYERDGRLLDPDSMLLGTEEELLGYFDGESIDPQPQVREALMMELPLHPVCGAECRGLCPRCGANLNTGACACAPEPEEEATPSGNEAWKDALKKVKLDG